MGSRDRGKRHERAKKPRGLSRYAFALLRKEDDDARLLTFLTSHPDISGTFIGQSFLAFIAPTGFVALQYNPANSGDVMTTVGRYTSWQCIDQASLPVELRNMSVSRNVIDAVTYDTNGVVASSGTTCNVYVVDVERGRQWTTAGEDGRCPSVDSLDMAFVQGPNSYVNTQLVNATILTQPTRGGLVCGGGLGVVGVNVTSPASPKPSPGLNVTAMPEVGTTLSGFPSSSSTSFMFPPELAGESIARSSYNATTVISTGANATFEITVETLEVTNGEGYALVGLTSIDGAPQRFSSVIARGNSYEYLNTSSTYVKTQSSVVYIDEDVTVSRYDPSSCALIRLNTDVLTGYRSTQFLNSSVACPTAEDASNWKRSNTTDTVDVTKLVNFPPDGAVRPATALARSSGASEDGATVFELSITPSRFDARIAHFNLNLTSADRVVGVEIRNQTGTKGVVLQLVPADGWPTAIVDGANKTLPSLLGPLSGSYDLQGAFELSTEEVSEGGAYFVNVRTEAVNGTARGDLVWGTDAGSASSGVGDGGEDGGKADGGVDGAIFRPNDSGEAWHILNWAFALFVTCL